MGKLFLVLISVSLLAACAPTANTRAPSELSGSATAQSHRIVVKTTPAEVFAGDIPEYVNEVLKPTASITYDARLPAHYDPSKPATLLVYIPPQPRLAVPRSWGKELDRRNVILIAARNSGNTVTNGKRIAYALMARVVTEQRWQIDPAKAYVSGFSGGGRVTSILTPTFPKAFTGAIYFSGVNFVSEAPELYPGVADHRFVFIAGQFDFNLNGTREVHELYREAGISRTRLIEVPGMEHELPPGEVLGQALDFLAD